MMDVQQAIRERRSIRRFTDQVVLDETVEQLLQAVRWAPSWANSQCWEVIVVRDAVIRHRLREILSPKNPAGPAMEKVSVVFAMAAAMEKSGWYKGLPVTKFFELFMYDLGLATANLCLTAHGLGLGSVVVGAFDHDRAREILELPEGYEVVTLIPVGYPDHAPSAPKRREIAEFAHRDRFSAG
ncbi:MAG: nitroreductase family protein [Thermodesulfobacteriota bacterium]